MLTVDNVTKKYKKFKAIDELSFRLNDGETGVLLGPNGAGKSTIIKCIAGLLQFSGTIEINGISNKDLDAKRQLGYVPEVPTLYDTLTIDEHLEFIRRAYKSDNKQYMEELIERFELGDKRRKLGRELSKGMQQKVSICCALIHDPSVIIFDEPLVGLDPHAIKELKSLINELKAQGKTILISTHMIDTIEETWDVVNIMMNGKIAVTRHNTDVMKAGEKSLDELFFEITEGRLDD
ncbi:MAG: ABC transporter ATP-binding protein [Clostridiales bacterium]|jgi:ABC-type multidrug transport system ATPase subunit|nr:ABC transporter ATP-binding protein [Clostridiales bacterium]